MNSNLYQKEEFTRFILQLTRDACAGLYQKEESPFDETTDSQIRFYAEIFYARGLWKGLDKRDYDDLNRFDEAMALYQWWTTLELDRVCNEFIYQIDEVVRKRASEKSLKNSYIYPSYRCKKDQIKNKISSMLSEELAMQSQKNKNLALKY